MLKCLEEKYGLKVKRERFNIYFTIPYQTDAEEMVLIKVLSEKLSCEDISSISRLKILAVDDNKISRLLILQY
jgi:hypothetical protein